MSIHINPFSPMSGPGLGKVHNTTDDVFPDTTEVRRRGRGFADLDPKELRELASMGGKKAHRTGRAHQWTPEEARAASKKAAEAKARLRAMKEEQGKL